MADNKDITDQTKQSIRTIKSEAETGVKFIKQESKDATTAIKQESRAAKTDIKNATKDAKDSVKQSSEKAINDIKGQQERSVEAISNATKKAQVSFEKSVDKTVDKATTQLGNEVESAVEQVTDSVQQAASKVADEIEKVKEKSIDSINKVVDEQKKKLTTSPQPQQDGNKKQAPDLATKLLQDILSEVKVLRKVTEGRVKFDIKSGRYRGAGGRYVKETDVRETQAATREKDEKEKKKKGMFGELRNKFVAVKKQLAPLAEGGKQVSEGVSGLATNPLVIAGLLAFLAPKEVLSFIKGFLGEMLFGESANAFTQSIGAFVGLWAGFKIYNAFKNLVTVVKGLWTVARFLFANPILTLALLTIVAGLALMSEFKKKYGKRMERKALEDELKQLEGKTYEDTDQGRQQKAADQARIEQIKGEIAKFSEQNVYSTTGQAQRAAVASHNTSIAPGSRAMQDVVEEITKYDAAVAKQKAGQQLTPAEQQTLQLFPNRDQIFKDYGFTTPEQKAAVEQAVQKKKQPVAETRPQPTSTTPPTTTGSTAAVATPADTAQNDRELSRAASQTNQPTSSSVTPSPATAQEAEKPKLETPTPATGLSINESSAAVEAGYEETPQDSTTVVSQDSTQIPKKANVIDTIPGIVPDRSSFSLYEFFGVVPLPSSHG